VFRACIQTTRPVQTEKIGVDLGGQATLNADLKLNSPSSRGRLVIFYALDSLIWVKVSLRSERFAASCSGFDRRHSHFDLHRSCFGH